MNRLSTVRRCWVKGSNSFICYVLVRNGQLFRFFVSDSCNRPPYINIEEMFSCIFLNSKSILCWRIPRHGVIFADLFHKTFLSNCLVLYWCVYSRQFACIMERLSKLKLYTYVSAIITPCSISEDIWEWVPCCIVSGGLRWITNSNSRWHKSILWLYKQLMYSRGKHFLLYFQD